MTRDEITKNKKGLSYANLIGANLSGANLSGANLIGANLRGADLSNVNLSGADLSNVNLSNANLSNANLSYTSLRNANLSYTSLRNADLSNANLSGADLSGADLRDANLSGAKGLLDPAEWIIENFEITHHGIIVYKTFGTVYIPNKDWVVNEGKIIEEVPNTNRQDKCGCGVNVATLAWVRRHTCRTATIWKCLIVTIDLLGCVVPYNTDGKFRASRVKLLEIVK